MQACKAQMGSISVTYTIHPMALRLWAQPLPTWPYPQTTTCKRQKAKLSWTFCKVFPFPFLSNIFEDSIIGLGLMYSYLFASKHDIRGSFEAVNDRLTTRVQVIKACFDNGIIHIHGWRQEFAWLGHLIQPVNKQLTLINKFVNIQLTIVNRQLIMVNNRVIEISTTFEFRYPHLITSTRVW